MDDAICKMCVYHAYDEDGDIGCSGPDCYEYIEFIALPVYAAAPDMYEALKTIKEFMARGGFLGNRDKPYLMLLEALSKAEGRTD